ncbi:hypothetical protein TNIN_181071 [Trichonephila inaurata madagascariensis]|uniref:Uncharacterized protein n=1 Tax=Trichonephila inaurata madagascariensis TaxID=2747483 RepID=A0A8X6YGH2_9ARAC|nr:hypothetical protein TNIN_181071 [Trichonephila inaurata madagascariensis]
MDTDIDTDKASNNGSPFTRKIYLPSPLYGTCKGRFCCRCLTDGLHVCSFQLDDRPKHASLKAHPHLFLCCHCLMNAVVKFGLVKTVRDQPSWNMRSIKKHLSSVEWWNLSLD